MFKQVSTLTSAVMIAALLGFSHGALAQEHFIRHVDIANGSPSGDGTAWGEDAYKYLQDALAWAAAWVDANGADTVDIWVAAAFDQHDDPIPYRPDQGAGVTEHDQTESFHLIENVRIFGGFPPNPHDSQYGQDGATMDDRDPELWETFLSGDLAGDDIVDDSAGPPFSFGNYCDNSHHVLTAAGVGDTAVLDGFVIQGGQAAGLIATDARPRVFNCVFMPSTCAAVHLRGDSSVVFVDCEFAGSDASAVVIDTEARGYFVDRRRGTVTERAGGE